MRLLWEEVWGVLSHLSFKDAGPAYSPCKQVPLFRLVLLAGSAVPQAGGGEAFGL